MQMPHNHILSVWEQAARDADATLELPGGIPMFFRRIATYSFRMGSRGYCFDEEPVHQVYNAQDFYLGTFVVTQEQFRAVANRCPALKGQPDPSHFKGQRRPVEQVSWRDAIVFCDWLTRMMGKALPEDGSLACLPTEAEWEYACRAGSETEYYNGDGEAALAEVAWYYYNSSNKTHPVDEPLNEQPERHLWGLYGMHGNVWEWCHDEWEQTAYRTRVDGACDPGRQQRLDDWRAGLDSWVKPDRDRVLRGGSWGLAAWGCRSASRLWCRPGNRAGFVGFRVCLVRGPVAKRGAQKR